MNLRSRSSELGLCLYFLETGKATRYLEIKPTIKRIATLAHATGIDKLKAAAHNARRKNIGKTACAQFSLNLPLGFEVECSLISGHSCLVVSRVEDGGQAKSAQVAVGHWLRAVGTVQVSSIEKFTKEVEKRRDRGEEQCEFEFKVTNQLSSLLPALDHVF